MSQIRICGGRRLEGSLWLQGSKNAVLPILAAVILHPGVTCLVGVPEIADVEASVEILRHLGCRVFRDGGRLTVDASQITTKEIPRSLGERMRSSILFLGALLARVGEGVLYRPGGCAIGSRPINLHVSGLRQLGCSFCLDDARIGAEASLQPAQILLPTPSVGATEQLLLAAAGVPGTVILRGCAREPEIGVLCDFLSMLGVAEIQGRGTDTLVIAGGGGSRDICFEIPGDRIAAGTYLAAAALTAGSLELSHAPVADMRLALHEFRRMGCRVEVEDEVVKLTAPRRLTAIPWLRTAPYPGFPTDLQSLFLAMHTLAEGEAVIEETVFESRLAMADELIRMGARLRVEGCRVFCQGVRHLHGTQLHGQDLRSTAALAVAALAAEGESVLSGYEHAARGYEDFVGQLRRLGAEVSLVG